MPQTKTAWRSLTGAAPLLAPKGRPPLVVPEVIGWRVWMVFGSGKPIMYSRT